jgi:hypothetical protein
MKETAAIKSRTKLQNTQQALRYLRKLKGLFLNKGPKDPVAWQRAQRRDRLK